MKLLILSDLHNEFEPLSAASSSVAEADVVVLAGDTHTKDRSVAWAKTFSGDLNKPVIMVAGNHEFYGGHFTSTLEKLRREAEGSNVHFLENESLVIGGVRFLGCTLWTDFHLDVSDISAVLSMRRAQESMNDFRKIRATPTYRKLYPADTVRRHEQSRAWLRNQLQTPFDGKTVVVTHHAPSRRSIEEQYQGDELTPAYASDLESLMGPTVSLWLHGHVHTNFDYVVSPAPDAPGTRVICNPRGYAPRYLNPTFNPALIVEV
ncbi:metallophosphoesterase [Burkholderia vietnamiensis]|uniref:metallophosphoesterase n=1 Tax=Burkholderia vietnamiensis TaxID=60552 RepID=UPI001589A7F0|nr:metallophosphoesterase [Burkholderia vietnamiensis]